jgi:hypothetical protein
MPLSRFRPTAAASDAGSALVAVLGSMAVLTLVLLGTLAYAVDATPSTRRDQDAKAATAAAQAGIDDYLTRLNANGSYWRTKDSTGALRDPGNPAMDPALPFGAAIAGTENRRGSFSYRVLSSEQQVTSTGLLRLAVTGYSSKAAPTDPTGKPMRHSVIATLQPVGFIKYVYYTDVEAVDPVLYSSRVPVVVDGAEGHPCQAQTTCTYFAHPATVNTLCARYYYAGRTDRYVSSNAEPYYVYNPHFDSVSAGANGKNVVLKSGCRQPTWTTGDVVDGPLHSNDALQITGSVEFKHPSTETSWPDASSPAPVANRRWWGPGTPHPSSKLPFYYPPVELPDSNDALLTHAQAHGCVYTGATRIVFTETSMRVLSPNSTTVNRPECLTVANRATEQVISPIPPVTYVRSSTTTSCTGVGYPITNESKLGAVPDHDCRRGHAYVRGVLQGNTTVGTDNDIVIAGNLTYRNGTAGSDILGLVANTNVWVYHPVRDTGSTTCTPQPHCRGANLLSATDAVHDIQAAILSVRHSFLVQSWDYGPLVGSSSRKLNVTGSISQKFRGPVGHGAVPSGYLKNYVYDSRLNTIPPPFFTQPKQSPWVVTKVTG